MSNLLLMTDSYKAGHSRLYSPGLEHLYLYMESRGGLYDRTVWFGLSYYLQKYLAQGLTLEDVDEAEEFWTEHFNRDDYFDADAWRRMYHKHGGAFPLLIQAVPEGSIIPTRNVLMTIESTDPEFAWLPGWFETLLMKVWYPVTIATQSYFIRQSIKRHFIASGSNLAALDFSCHDFGYRGSTSEESAGIGAAAHLVSFNGTDTVAGNLLLRKYYDERMAGVSIPAEEHSTIMSFGPSGEVDAYQHLLDQYPTGIIACVSDTYDLYHAVNKIWGETLGDQVFKRDGKLVVRPDSGEFMEIVPDVMRSLSLSFRQTHTPTGHVLLNSHVGVIQGDGMNPATIDALYGEIVECGFAAESLAVGSGGGLLQNVDRDTCKFAIKASQATVRGRVMNIFKNPRTDPKKRSKAGLQSLILTDSGYQTVQGRREDSLLQTVFHNGFVTVKPKFSTIRSLVRG